MCQRTKLHKNRLNRWGDMVIFTFFKMAGYRHLGFLIFQFFNGQKVKRVELHHCAKICRNRFNRGRDIVIFRFFKVAASAILDF